MGQCLEVATRVTLGTLGCADPVGSTVVLAHPHASNVSGGRRRVPRSRGAVDLNLSENVASFSPSQALGFGFPAIRCVLWLFCGAGD